MAAACASSAAARNPLAQLPAELWFLCARFLGARELCRLARVDRASRALTADDELWRDMLLRRGLEAAAGVAPKAFYLFATAPRRVVLGNTHEIVQAMLMRGNSHRWRVFLRSASGNDDELAAVVERVTFELHPTFFPTTVRVATPPFALERVGWGFFEVGVRVEFRAALGKRPLRLAHLLNFERPLTRRTLLLDFERTADQVEWRDEEDQGDEADGAGEGREQ
jgi:hypothetical protein